MNRFAQFIGMCYYTVLNKCKTLTVDFSESDNNVVWYIKNPLYMLANYSNFRGNKCTSFWFATVIGNMCPVSIRKHLNSL